MSLIVQKFGGTSVADVEKIRAAARESYSRTASRTPSGHGGQCDGEEHGRSTRSRFTD